MPNYLPGFGLYEVAGQLKEDMANRQRVNLLPYQMEMQKRLRDEQQANEMARMQQQFANQQSMESSRRGHEIQLGSQRDFAAKRDMHMSMIKDAISQGNYPLAREMHESGADVYGYSRIPENIWSKMESSSGPQRLGNTEAGRAYIEYLKRIKDSGESPKTFDIWMAEDWKQMGKQTQRDIEMIAAGGGIPIKSKEQAESILEEQQKRKLGQERAVIKEKSAAKARESMVGINRIKQTLGTVESLWNDLEPSEGQFVAATSGMARSLAGPYAEKSKRYNDFIKGMASTFSKSIGGESGALSEGDVVRAVSLAPVLTDTKQTAEKKLSTLRAIVDFAAKKQEEIMNLNMGPDDIATVQAENSREIDNIISSGGKSIASSDNDVVEYRRRNPSTKLTDDQIRAGIARRKQESK